MTTDLERAVAVAREIVADDARYPNAPASDRGQAVLVARALLDLMEWRPIETAPKSTVEHGGVRGKYLLGFLPDDEARDLQGCMSVIWWEPLAKGGRGCWYSDNGDEDARPTHWLPLPLPPPPVERKTHG